MCGGVEFELPAFGRGGGCFFAIAVAVRDAAIMTSSVGGSAVDEVVRLYEQRLPAVFEMWDEIVGLDCVKVRLDVIESFLRVAEVEIVVSLRVDVEPTSHKELRSSVREVAPVLVTSSLCFFVAIVVGVAFTFLDGDDTAYIH